MISEGKKYKHKMKKFVLQMKIVSKEFDGSEWWTHHISDYRRTITIPVEVTDISVGSDGKVRRGSDLHKTLKRYEKISMVSKHVLVKHKLMTAVLIK
jgi:hypothetical protein